MTHSTRTLPWIGLCAVVASCAGASGSSDAGKGSSGDAGVDAGMWTTHPILGNMATCDCPGQTAASLTSAASGSAAVEWLRSFTPTTLNTGDELVLNINFAGPATWQIGMVDETGKLAFPTTGGRPLDTTNWNCLQVAYQVGPDTYEVYVNGAGMSANMPPMFTSTTSVAGVEVDYSGTGASSAWIDSVVVTYIPMGGASKVLLSESFDNPASASDGLKSGDGTVATPPASIMIPNPCIAVE